MMNEQAVRAVRSEPFILIPHTVTDLDDFAAHPDKYLVSMFGEPERAADIWRNRLKKNPYGSEGLLALTYHDVELIPADLWDEVTGIWSELVELVEAFIEEGTSESLFPGQPTPLRLATKGKSTLFTVGHRTVRVDPQDFIPGLLDEAHRYYAWVEKYIGTRESHAITSIASLRSQFGR